MNVKALAVAVGAAIGVLGGCASSPARIDRPPSDRTSGLSVTVIERGWHTDIALPTLAISGSLAALGREFPGERFLVFGFGDRAYYMAPDPPFPGMLAALLPGPGVILVTALRVEPAEAFGADNVVTLPLSPSQLAAIIAFVRSGLATGTDGSMQRLGDGPYPGSAFYASDGSYDAFENCNYWTISALRSGGLPVDPDGVIFAGQVMDLARRLKSDRE